MYESIEKLRPEKVRLLSRLKPSSVVELADIRKSLPSVPEEYLLFMQERGPGEIKDTDEEFVHLQIYPNLINAETGYYFDKQIYEDGPYEPGAKGLVWLFATNSTGIAFGFDSGDNWRLLEIDNNRLITRLDLTFRQFIEGALVCYPQLPRRYANGQWIVD